MFAEVQNKRLDFTPEPNRNKPDYICTLYMFGYFSLQFFQISAREEEKKREKSYKKDGCRYEAIIVYLLVYITFNF